MKNLFHFLIIDCHDKKELHYNISIADYYFYNKHGYYRNFQS